MMYKSPIELKIDDIVYDVEQKVDEYVLKCTQQVGVCVDMDALIKALEYERNQYDRGWTDRDNEIVRCMDCVYCKCFNDVWISPQRGELLCTFYVGSYHTTESDYCSHGERRKERR